MTKASHLYCLTRLINNSMYKSSFCKQTQQLEPKQNIAGVITILIALCLPSKVGPKVRMHKGSTLH